MNPADVKVDVTICGQSVPLHFNVAMMMRYEELADRSFFDFAVQAEETKKKMLEQTTADGQEVNKEVIGALLAKSVKVRDVVYLLHAAWQQWDGDTCKHVKSVAWIQQNVPMADYGRLLVAILFGIQKQQPQSKDELPTAVQSDKDEPDPTTGTPLTDETAGGVPSGPSDAEVLESLKRE